MPIFPRPTDPQAGFTLIEMLVVLTVIGLLAGLAFGMAPRPGGTADRARLEAALRGDLRQAAETAVRTRKPASVDFAAEPYKTLAAQYRPEFIADAHTGTSRLMAYSDGSTSGGTLSLRGTPVLTISWANGAIAHAR